MPTDQETQDHDIARVRDAMADRIHKHVTPIALREAEGRGRLLGTANFVRSGSRNLLLTNAHVVGDAKGGSIGFLHPSIHEYVELPAPVHGVPHPIDLAVFDLGSNSDSDDVPPCMLRDGMWDRRFAPCAGEFLFWIGYPGNTARADEAHTVHRDVRNWFGGDLDATAVPYAVQQAGPPEHEDSRFDSAHHAWIHHPREARRHPGGIAEVTPRPEGMSGGLLWDTKFVANGRSDAWAATDAKICGLIWGVWPEVERAVITRIDFVLSELAK